MMASDPTLRPPELDLSFRANVTIAPMIDLSVIDGQHKRIFAITGCTFSGQKLKGIVQPSGATSKACTDVLRRPISRTEAQGMSALGQNRSFDPGRPNVRFAPKRPISLRHRSVPFVRRHLSFPRLSGPGHAAPELYFPASLCCNRAAPPSRPRTTWGVTTI